MKSIKSRFVTRPARIPRVPAIAATAALALAGVGLAANPASAVSVAPVGQSSVIAARGPFGSLRFYWQTIGTAPWNPEVVAGAGTTAG